MMSLEIIQSLGIYRGHHRDIHPEAEAANLSERENTAELRSILSEYVMLKSAIGANKSGDILLVGALSSIIVRHCDRRYNSKPEQRRRRRRTKAAFGDRERERER